MRCPYSQRDPDPPEPHEPDGFDPVPHAGVSRRQFLRSSAMALAGATLYACTGGGSKVPVRVTQSPPTTIETQWPIKRVLYVMLENRSFDNLFGRFPGVEAASTGVTFGREVPLRPCPDWLPGDLPHDRAAALNCLNGGTLDGFATGIYGPYFAYTQLQEPQIPNYWFWAREYAISDHFFASALGPSYPNHFFFIAGQSGGTIDNPENIGTRPIPGSQYPFKSWGCDAIGSGLFVFVKDDKGNLTKHETCFEFRTVGEQLTEAGVDWAYYAAVPGQVGYFWSAYNGIGQVFHDRAYWNAHVRPVDRLIRDIEANRLPAVTWVTPVFQLSDHPPASTSGAHNWVTDIVNAVMRSQMWSQTVIFITWDEWGGFYDHVVPPAVDETGLGLRVPLLTIGPYVAGRGLVDDQVGEFSTPLRFIADNWGLDYLTPRIANTHNFAHVFDFGRRPRPPAIADRKVKTYGGNPLDWPFENGGRIAGWPAGTVPVTDPW